MSRTAASSARRPAIAQRLAQFLEGLAPLDGDIVGKAFMHPAGLPFGGDDAQVFRNDDVRELVAAKNRRGCAAAW
jgi:hypothetical protein